MKKVLLVSLVLAGCGDAPTRFVPVEGTPGKDGKNCATEQAEGGIYVICEGSDAVFISNGRDGATGATGPVGAPGADGAPGPAGTNATPITVVQFCPNVVPTYPNRFPEYGLVINGSIFGVYSANGGFLALLPPGDYHSNAIGSSCNFRINADATVSPL